MITPSLSEVREWLTCGEARCPCQRRDGNVHCPVASHADENPSCAVSAGKSADLVLKCFGGCTQEQVWEAVIALAGSTRRPMTEETHTQPTRYWYTDGDGENVFCVDRYYTSGGQKRFRPSHVCNGRMVNGMGGESCGCADVPRLLYNLQNVMTAPQVFWVEGEKDVHTLQKHGVVATCTPQGSQSFGRCLVSNPNLLDALNGKEVFVIADNDTPGIRYAREVSERLMHHASKIWLVQFPEEMPQGYDISDHLSTPDVVLKDFIHDSRNLVFDASGEGEVIDVLPPYSVNGVGDISMAFRPNGLNAHIEVLASRIDSQSTGIHAHIKVMHVTTMTGRKSTILPSTAINLSNDTARSALAKSLRLKRAEYDWVDIIDKTAIAVGQTIESDGQVVDVKHVETSMGIKNWLFEPLLEYGEHAVVYSHGGVGKSLLAGACVLSVATGRAFISGMTPHASGVASLYLDWEDSEQSYASRLHRMAEGMGVEMPAGLCHYMHMKYMLEDQLESVRREIDSRGIELVIVDSIGAAVGDINKPDTATRYQSMVHALNCAVLSITHVSKAGWQTESETPEPIGSVYFMNGPRAAFFLAGDDNGEFDSKEHVLVQTKSNSGALGRPIGYKASYGSHTGAIAFEHAYPFRNPRLRRHCRLVDTLEFYLCGDTLTAGQLADQMPEIRLDTIERCLRYYGGKRFRQLPDNLWTAIVGDGYE